MFNHLRLITASTLTLLALGAIQAPKALAVQFVQDFSVSDPLFPPTQPFTGFFVYDDAGITGAFRESVPLTAFNFNFLGQIFNDASTGEATFFNGNFVGINLSSGTPDVDPIAFTFAPGFNDVNQAIFSFDLQGSNGSDALATNSQTSIGSAGVSNNGLVGFADNLEYGEPRPVTRPVPQPVPGPSVIPGLVSIGIAALWSKRHQHDEAK